MMLSNALPALSCRARVWLSAVKCLPPTHPLTLNNQFSSSGSMNPKIWPCRPPPQTAHLSHLNELLLERERLSQSYLLCSYTDYWMFHCAKHLINETQKVKIVLTNKRYSGQKKPETVYIKEKKLQLDFFIIIINNNNNAVDSFIYGKRFYMIHAILKTHTHKNKVSC